MKRVVYNATTSNEPPADTERSQSSAPGMPETAWLAHVNQVQLNLVLKSVPVLLWTTDTELTITSGTGAYLAEFGLEAKTFLDKSLKDMLARLGIEDQARPAHLRALQGETVVYELRRQGRMLRSTVEPLLDAAGEVIGTLGITLDITDYKQVSLQLQEVELRYQTLIEQLPAITYTVALGHEERTIFISPQVETILGFSQQAWLADDGLWVRQVHPDDRERVLEEVGKRKKAGQGFLIEYRVLAYDGSIRWFRNQSTIVQDPQGQPRYVHGVMFDITDRKTADDALKQSEKSFRVLFENHPHPMWVYNRETFQILEVNQAAIEIYGYSRAEFQRLRITDFRPAAEVPRLLTYVKENSAKKLNRAGYWRHQTKAGQIIDVEVTSHPLEFEGRNAQLVVAQEVTERRKMESEREVLLNSERQQRKRAEALYRISDSIIKLESIRAILQTVVDSVVAALQIRRAVIYTFDLENRKVLDYIEGGASSIPPIPFEELLDGLSGWVIRQRKPAFSPKGEPDPRESPAVQARRAAFHVGSLLVVPMIYRDEVLGTITISRFEHESDFDEQDIDLIALLANQTAVAIEQRRLAEQLAYQAQHDALTGLPNRSLFEDRLQQAIALAERSGKRVALFFIDLDRFKQINDTLGHHVGDELLKQVALRLAEQVRRSDTLARMGGDEFTLILGNLKHPADALRIAQKLLTVLSQPFQVRGHEFYVTGSIGISVYPDDGMDTAILQRNADSAMYRAKQRGKNTYQLFKPEMNEAAVERLQLENYLRKALDRLELITYYQPYIDLVTGRVIGTEALLRWQHPELGLVPPGKFIPVAEDSGLIVRIGAWVIEEACRQTKAWQDAGHGPLRVSVNVSPVQFTQIDFVKTVERALLASGLEPCYLELELTEGIVMQDIERAVAYMTELRTLGVRFSIDDFGTGYSSLAYLQKLPIDNLKIDRSFIMNLEPGHPLSASGLSLVKTIMALAHNLALHVTAEGVETPKQLRFLQETGCDQAQGFLLAKPQMAREIEKLFGNTFGKAVEEQTCDHLRKE